MIIVDVFTRRLLLDIGVVVDFGRVGNMGNIILIQVGTFGTHNMLRYIRTHSQSNSHLRAHIQAYFYMRVLTHTETHASHS